MNNRPFIILKQAFSIEGYLDNVSSYKFSNEEDLRRVHVLRSMVDAILVGAQTVRNDNPSLAIKKDLLKFVPKKQPVRVIIEGKEVLEDFYKVFSENEQETWVFRNKKNINDSKDFLYQQIPYDQEFVQIENVLEDLCKKGIRFLMVEGGAKIIEQFLSKNLIDTHRILYSNVLTQNDMATKISIDFDEYKNIKPEIQIINNMYELWFNLNKESEDFYQKYISLIR